MDLKSAIRTFPDYPAPGIMFRDITTLLKDGEALTHAINQMADALEGLDFDLIIAPESRGFIFGVPLALKFGKGFVPARKKGKLPGPVTFGEYTLEYGTDVIEVHTDAVTGGQKVVLVDDLLATGGTAKCICDIVAGMGGEVVRNVFLVELEGLGGREALQGMDTKSILTY